MYGLGAGKQLLKESWFSFKDNATFSVSTFFSWFKSLSVGRDPLQQGFTYLKGTPLLKVFDPHLGCPLRAYRSPEGGRGGLDLTPPTRGGHSSQTLSGAESPEKGYLLALLVHSLMFIMYLA